MSDVVEATQDHIVRKVDGKDCTFKFLNAYDRAELLRDDLKKRQEQHAQDKAELLENLKTADIKGEPMFVELQRHAESKPKSTTEYNWEMFVNDPMNYPALFQKSLAKSHPDADEISKKSVVSLEDRAMICGLKVVTQRETTDPNQTTPANHPYWTPEQNSTGETPNSESATIAPA